MRRLRPIDPAAHQGENTSGGRRDARGTMGARGWTRTTAAAAVAVALVAAGPTTSAGAIEPAPEDLPQTPTVDVTRQVVDLTFPVTSPDVDVWFSDDFLALRGGGSRLHGANDMMAPKHRPVVAAVGGTLTWVPYAPGRDGYTDLGEPTYGWMVSLRGDDGRRYSYVHLNNDTPARDADGAWLDDDLGGIEHAYAPRIVEALRERGSASGLRVERGELIGWVGDSGNAKGVTPHLHFEIHVTTEEHGEYRINPYDALVAAFDRGDTVIAADRVADTTPLPNGRYLDVPDGAAHAEAIEQLSDDGIAFGCDDQRYCPGAAIRRGEIAAFLAAALDLDVSSTPDAAPFDDVSRDHDYAAAIAAVEDAGYLYGYGDGRFGVEDPLNRAQLATTLVRAFGVPETTQRAPFDDVPATATHAGSIAATYVAGLTLGCDDGSRFCPGQPVTRAQYASFLVRGMAYTDGG